MISRTSFLTVLLSLAMLDGAYAQWYPFPGLTGRFIHTVLVTDSALYAGGQGSTLLRSTNNGETWEDIKGIIEADTIYALGYYRGSLFAGTSRGGYTTGSRNIDWHRLTLPGLVFRFYSLDTVLFAGTGGVYSSTDHGATWLGKSDGLPFRRSVIDLAFNGRTLFAILDGPTGIYISTNGGISWKLGGFQNRWGRALAVIDTNVYAGMSNGVFQYSGSDTTWIERNNGLPTPTYVYSLFAFRRILFAGTSHGVFYSTDLAATWQEIDSSDPFTLLAYALTVSGNELLVGTERGLWKRSISDLVSVGSVPGPPSEFLLSQNYPNPFNPTTNIRFQVASSEVVRLVVYDVLGREVAVLVNELKHPGIYTATWNALNLPSGVYYCRMSAGGYMEVRKMMLLR